VIDWKREAGRKAAAVSLAVRVVGLVIPVRLLDENLLPFAASSARGIYITQWKDGIRVYLTSMFIQTL